LILLGASSTPDGLHPYMRRSMTQMYERLLSEQELNKVKDKFYEDIEFVLEEAIRKHHNIQATSIPWWIYLMLAFFAADNVMGWLSSPFIFYPLMLVVGGIAMLYSMGLGSLMGPLARQSVNLGLRNVGLNF
jgi:hypothetical protein